MKRVASILFTLAICLTHLAIGQKTSLEPVRSIGVPWTTDEWRWMSFAAFNQSGHEVASDGGTAPGDRPGELSFWTFPEGRFIGKLAIEPTAISDDFKYYATRNSVGEVATGHKLLSLGDEAYASFVFSHDSHYVAESVGINASSGQRIRVFALPNINPVSAFSRSSAQSMAISPDGTVLASGHWDVVVLWNLHSGKPIGMLKGFRRYVRGIAFSKDGSLVAAGTDTGGVQVWDVRRRERISSAEMGGGDASALAFNPNGSLLAVGVYGTGTAWLIATKTGQVLDHHRVSDLGCGSVAFSPDGRYLITPSTGGLITWPYDRGGSIRVFRVKSHSPH